MVVRLVLAIALVVFSSARAQKLPPDSDWQETYTKNVPVSGALRVGVMAGADESRVDPSRLAVYLPKHTLPKLWVDIRSQDGRYDAHLEYDIKNVPPGECQLGFPTRYGDVLSNYPKREVAILATLHRGKLIERIDSSISAIAVASWDDTVELDTVVVLLNIVEIRHSSLLVATESDSVEFPCYQIDEDVLRTAYTTRCQVCVNDSLQLDKTVIKQWRFRTRFDDVPLPVMLK